MSKPYHASQNLMRARCFLLAKEPWYGHASASIDWLPDSTISTMSVEVRPDGNCCCRYNPAFVCDHDLYEVAAVIQHEIEHIVRQHCFRIIEGDQRLANIACDMAVNGHQRKPSIGFVNPRTGEHSLPLDGHIVWMPKDWPRDLTAEQCYHRLLNDGQLQRKLVDAPLLDTHQHWQATSLDPATARASAGQLVQVAVNAGATVPDRVREACKELATAVVPWQHLLHRFVRRASAKASTDWGRPSRRIDVFGMPGRKRKVRCRLAVIVDVSGSVSEPILSRFFAELEKLSLLASLVVLTWDDRKREFISPYRNGDWTRLASSGGGGTDMAAPMDWLRSGGHCGDGVIMLTDGYCIWPKPAPVPFLVVCSSAPGQVEPPTYGHMIHLKP